MYLTRTRKLKLLSTCGSAALALGTAVLPAAAGAQAIQATPTIVQGTVSINSTVANQDTITVTGTNAVIDWQPSEISGTALTYLPSTGTATFQGTPGASTFAVINRILPSTNNEVVQIDGRVVSQVQLAAGGPFTPGGHVMFYSPTGLLIGPNAVMDVAGLVLTTLEPDINQFGAFATSGGALTVSASTLPAQNIAVSGAATINAPAEGSYVLMAAPGITQSGTLTINGSTAYVLGEAATVSHSSGLFDITISTGAQGGGLFHDGTTTGPASSGAGDNHVIYAVGRGFDSAPTNRMDLIFFGNLGFDPAVSATVENGVVILAANYRVSGTTVVNDLTGGTIQGGSEGTVLIQGGNVTSDLFAHASHDAILASPGGIVSLDGDAFLYGQRSVLVTVIDAGQVDISGNATLVTSMTGPDVPSPNTPSILDGVGGSVAMHTQGGTIRVGGNTALVSVATPGADTVGGLIGNATGGNAEIFAEFGNITLQGSLTIDTSALPYAGPAPRITGGNATAGAVTLRAENGSVLSVTGPVTVAADGVTTPLTSAVSTSIPGVGQGGNVLFTALVDGATAGDNAILDLQGNVSVRSLGWGADNSAGVGGAGRGGNVTLDVSSSGQIIVGGTLALDSIGLGGSGNGGDGGEGTGGAVALAGITAGLIDIRGATATLTSSALGGISASASGGRGLGGQVAITGNDANFGALGLAMLSEGLGGVGVTSGGQGTGGRVAVSLAAAAEVVALDFLSGRSEGIGGGATGIAGIGGTGTGGNIDLTLDGGRIDSPLATVTFQALGRGGTGVTGGTASSGNFQLLARNASLINTNSLAGYLVAQGGAGSTAPTGRGGTATAGTNTVTLESATLLQASTAAAFTNGAFGGTGNDDNGGNANGGTALFTVDNARIDLLAGTLDIGTGATGGTGLGTTATTITGGSAAGGVAQLVLRGGADLNLGNLRLTSTALGGSSTAREGGDATSAGVILNMTGASTLDIAGGAVGQPLIQASVRGGNTGGGDGIGGSAGGASTQVIVDNNAALTFSPVATGTPPYIGTISRGGDSSLANGSGGTGAGGSTTITLTSNGVLNAGRLAVWSQSRGGDGVGNGAINIAGGNATAGLAEISLTGTTMSAELFLAATSDGGNALGAAAGGNATAGQARINNVNSTINLLGLSRVLSAARGGAGNIGGNSSGSGASITIGAGASLNFTDPAAELSVVSHNYGGLGQATGGNTSGGTATLTNDGGTIAGNRLQVLAVNEAGSNQANTDAGVATAGTAQFFTRNQGGSNLNTLVMRSIGMVGNGGTASSGTVQLVAQGAQTTLDVSQIQIDASATFGPTGSVGNSGRFLIDAIDGGRITAPQITATTGTLGTTPGPAQNTSSRLQALNGGEIVFDSAVALDTLGDLTFDTATGGRILGGATVTAPTGSLFASAAGTIFITGDSAATPSLVATQAQFSSRDIAVNAGARIVSQFVLLESFDTTNTAVLGGTTEGPGYTLTQAEFDRFQAQYLDLYTPNTANTQVDLDVRSLTFAGGLNPQGLSGLTIANEGIMQISGAVTGSQVSSTDNLGLFAADRIEFLLPAGQVSLTGAAGNTQPAGNIVVGTAALYAASSSLLTTIRTDPDSAILPILLGDSSGFTSPFSFLAADRITIEASNYLLTQNTKQAGTLGGILVGPGGLTIRQNADFAPNTARVITFGARDNGGGSFTTNNDFFAIVNYGSTPLSSYYTTDSKLNNCNILTGICGIDLPVPLTSEDLTELPDGSVPLDAVNTAAADAAFGVDFPDLFSPPTVDDQGLVDEPVTSGGEGADGEEDDEA